MYRVYFRTYGVAYHYSPQWTKQVTCFSESQTQQGFVKRSFGADACPVETMWGSRVFLDTPAFMSTLAHFLQAAPTSGGHDCHLAGLLRTPARREVILADTGGCNVISLRQELMRRAPQSKHMPGEEA